MKEIDRKLALYSVPEKIEKITNPIDYSVRKYKFLTNNVYRNFLKKSH